MFIVGLGTATPAQRHTQAECWEALSESAIVAGLSHRSRALLRKLLSGRNGIVSRYLALTPLAEFNHFDADALHARFLQHAPALATEASRRALADARIKPASVDGIVISTCTGYLCPGLTSYVVERLSMRSDVIALDLVGHGCGAALPNLQTGAALLGAGYCRTVLSVSVEICSAAFFLDDDPGVLVSACLFGDGAAAAVLSTSPLAGRRAVNWLGSRSLVDPASRDLLRFEQRRGMLRNVLKPLVPKLAATHASRLVTAELEERQMRRDDISTWIWHAAGRDVLDALGERIGLGEKDLRWSREVLHEHGNLSSASVLFVLQRALAGDTPNGRWWMSTFGAGFSCHGALLQVGS